MSLCVLVLFPTARRPSLLLQVGFLPVAREDGREAGDHVQAWGEARTPLHKFEEALTLGVT